MHSPAQERGIKCRCSARLGRIRRTSLLGILGLLMGVPAGHATEANLVAMSPFLSNSSASPMPDSFRPLELRGIMTTPRGPLFAICDPAQKFSGTWIGLNEVGLSFVVRAYRVVAGEDQVTVDYQGRSLVLILKKSRVAAGTIIRSGPPRPTLESIASEGLPGVPASELLPQEAARLELLTNQVRARMDRQKEKEAEPAMTPSPQKN